MPRRRSSAVAPLLLALAVALLCTPLRLCEAQSPPVAITDDNPSGSPASSPSDDTAESPSPAVSPSPSPATAVAPSPAVVPSPSASPSPSPSPSPVLVPAVAPSPAPSPSPAVAASPSPAAAAPSPAVSPSPVALAPSPAPVVAPSPTLTPSPSPAAAPAPVAASPSPAQSPSPATAATPSPAAADAPSPSADAPAPGPADTVTIGAQFLLSGRDLLPFDSSKQATFEKVLKQVLGAGSLSSVTLDFLGSQNVTGSTSSSGGRRLLQSGTQSVTIFYDLQDVPSDQASDVRTTLAASATASSLAALLAANGLAVSGASLVRTSNGGIVVPAAASPGSPTSGTDTGGGGLSGGAIGGIIAGAVVILLIIAALLIVCCLVLPRRRRRADEKAAAFKVAPADVGVRTAAPFNGAAIKQPTLSTQGQTQGGELRSDSAFREDTIPAHRLSTGSSGTTPRQLLGSADEASAPALYVPPPRDSSLVSMARRWSGRQGPNGPTASPFAPAFG